MRVGGCASAHCRHLLGDYPAWSPDGHYRPVEERRVVVQLVMRLAGAALRGSASPHHLLYSKYTRCSRRPAPVASTTVRLQSHAPRGCLRHSPFNRIHEDLNGRVAHRGHVADPFAIDPRVFSQYEGLVFVEVRGILSLDPFDATVP